MKKVQDSILSLAQIMCNSYWDSLRIPGALATRARKKFARKARSQNFILYPELFKT